MTIIFVHIPKTAGMAIKTALSQNSSAPLITYNGYGSDGQPFPLRYRMLESYIRMLFPYSAHPQQLEKLWEAYVLRTTSKCIYGHLNMKCYSIPTHDGWKPHTPFRYVAFMRNPLDRAISQYYYNITGQLQNPSHYNLRKFTDHFPKLEDFLLSTQFANYQSKYMIFPEQFDFIGITERMHQSLAILRRLDSMFHTLPDTQVINQGTNKNNIEIQNLPLAIIQKFTALNCLDYQLYSNVVTKLDHASNAI